jgi:hypothetical protein
LRTEIQQFCKDMGVLTRARYDKLRHRRKKSVEERVGKLEDAFAGKHDERPSATDVNAVVELVAAKPLRVPKVTRFVRDATKLLADLRSATWKMHVETIEGWLEKLNDIRQVLSIGKTGQTTTSATRRPARASVANM